MPGPGKVPIPVDAVCAKEFSATATPTLKAIENLEAGRHDPRHRPDDDRGAEDDHREGRHDRLERAGRRVRVRRVRRRHQGPRRGDRRVAGVLVAGGGDTIAAIDKFGIADGSPTFRPAGGAFLEFLEGKTLPAVAMLEARATA